MIFPHPDHRYRSIVSNEKSLSIANLLLIIFVLNYEYKDIKFLNPPTTQFEASSPSEKIAGGFQQAGKKEGGLSVIPTRNFCPPTKKAKPRRPARSEQSPAKKFSFPFRKKSRAKSKNAKKTFLRGGER